MTDRGDAQHSDLPDEPGPSGDGGGLAVQAGAALFGLMAVLVAVDLLSDADSGEGVLHLLIEGGLLVASLAGVGLLWRTWLKERATARRAIQDRARAEGQAERWRGEADRWRGEAAELLRGLGSAIDQQFEAWQLSPAEKEVGLLLLKGLSYKEAAAVRGASERTVRQQGQAVFRKGDLRGRAELSAFFLEDLLLPAESVSPPSGPPPTPGGSPSSPPPKS